MSMPTPPFTFDVCHLSDELLEGLYSAVLDEYERVRDEEESRVAAGAAVGWLLRPLEDERSRRAEAR